MARIEPFRGLRANPKLVDKIAAPPYDVLSSVEARKMAAGNPYSFLHVGKPEIDLPPGVDLYSEQVYAKGRENFMRFVREGVLAQDEKKCFYIYKQIWGNHVQTGLVAGASCADYQRGAIKKHELTRADKEKDRMRHIEVLGAQTGPVFLTYQRRAAIDKLVAAGMAGAAAYDFSSADGVRHIFHVVDDEILIRKIKKEFSRLEYLYVADGHHRSAAAVHIQNAREKENPGHTGDEDYNFFLAVIFPHNQMKILPYNRVVKDLRGLGKAEFFSRIAERFSCEETSLKEPPQVHQFCLYFEGKWYLLEAKEGSFPAADAIAALDVSILQNNLLAPVLGIADPRTDKRIDFVGGIRGTLELERRVDAGEMKAAFSLRPTTIEQLFAVADAGKFMPPKSTWFEPKLKDGLVSHLIE